MADETTIQELFDDFDVRLIRQGTDGAEALDIPFRDVAAIITRMAVERIMHEKPAAIEVPLIIKP